MSDKRGSISKVVQKHAGRAKERLLQNLGKADKTTDDLFETYVHNFKKQQNGAHKLNKELKNYIFCVRAMQAANKGLLDTLSETYEQEWVGYEQIPIKAQSLELLVEDFCMKLTDQVSAPLNSYINQFPDMRSKIAKRNRKMVDYDSSRHNLEALLHSGKKRDEMKIGKAREHLDEAKRSYEVLNRELHDDLPSLYDSRIPFLVTNLQSFFAAEAVFHGECTKVYTQLSDLIERLGMENQKGRYKSRNSWKIRPSKNETDARQYEEIEFKRSSLEKKKPNSLTGEIKMLVSPDSKEHSCSDVSENSRTHFYPDAIMPSLHKTTYDEEYEPIGLEDDIDGDTGRPIASKKPEELYDIPVGATTVGLPSGVFYRVLATHKYTAEDGDELDFEPGEIIQVVEYNDPDEQEEGWLMGIKESTNEKGLFPANFSRPI
ncbi:myc box-dependent-interacting protein 1-like isoform X2 [Tachypleus tridentatus]|uniref:myc box-dependent-interacting protein 1-like isoform X2 n=1 Tax=Tachypleus tridentatus TaxID=6853 RepID=UPI003FD3ADD6